MKCSAGGVTFVLAVVGLLLCGPAAAEDARSLLVEAQEEFQQEDYAKALARYEEADKAEPGHAAVQYNIGLCHLELGETEKALPRFEAAASQTEVSRSLRADAFYNMGLIQATNAYTRYDKLHAPATQPADQVPPDAPANIGELEGIAADLLGAIASLRQSREIDPSDETEHNMRAARIKLRNVLGLLREARKAKDKEDFLDDPRGYLEGLILNQEQAVCRTRALVLDPPAAPAQVRKSRRAAVRDQQRLMERTEVLRDHLLQFREAATHQDPNTPATTQPEGESPKEQAYHAAGRQISEAIQPQADACAHLVDGEVEKAFEKQSAALDKMYAALYLFPLDPKWTLTESLARQTQLKALVTDIGSDEHWLRFPRDLLLGEVRVAEGVAWEPDKTAIHDRQSQIGQRLVLLKHQCRYVAAMSQPAQEAASPETAKDPLLDAELNGKLADALEGVEDLSQSCVDAIAAKDKEKTLEAQDKLIAMIEAALKVFPEEPKTLEQKIAELIVRQARLNSEIVLEDAAVGSGGTAQTQEQTKAWTDFVESKLPAGGVAEFAKTLGDEQGTIRSETIAVNDECRQKIPTAGASQPAGSPTLPGPTPTPTGPASTPPGPAPTTQPSPEEVYIQASRHLEEAESHMQAGIEGFDTARIRNALQPLAPGGPVPTAQAKALEELIKALEALRRPPDEKEDKDKQDQEQKQQEPQPRERDAQRQIDQLDKERERAERELYQEGSRRVIKDW